MDDLCLGIYGSKGRFEAYVNPFKDCSTTERLYHIIDLVLQGKLSPEVIEPLPYVPGTLSLPDWALNEGNVICGDYEAIPQRVRELIYKDALLCWTRLRNQHNEIPMPSLRSKIADPNEGLRQIQERCIDVKRAMPLELPNDPITLKGFLKIACGIDSRSECEAIQKKLRQAKLLPKEVVEYKKGQSKFYDPAELYFSWQDWKKEIPSLPSLQFSENQKRPVRTGKTLIPKVRPK